MYVDHNQESNRISRTSESERRSEESKDSIESVSIYRLLIFISDDNVKMLVNLYLIKI